MREVRPCHADILAKLKKLPKSQKTPSLATCVALIQAALRGCLGQQGYSSDLKEAPSACSQSRRAAKRGLVGYLKKQAELVNPSAFMTGLSKLLPSVLREIRTRSLIVERVYYTFGTGTEAHASLKKDKPVVQ